MSVRFSKISRYVRSRARSPSADPGSVTTTNCSGRPMRSQKNSRWLRVSTVPPDFDDATNSVCSAGVWATTRATAAGSVLSGRVELPKNPFVASVWEMLAGATALACVGLARGEARGFDIGDVTASSWLGLAYLVVFGSVIAFSAYAWLLQNASVTLASTYAYVNPVVAVLLGALFVDEPITPRVVLGGAVVVAAVAVVVSTERPGRSDQP